MFTRQDYDREMHRGSDAYRDALEALKAGGLPAQFTQTGGMCAALEVHLERGYLLITDAGEELPWDRDDQLGWGVGFYDSEDVSEGPLEYVEIEEDSTPDSLVGIVKSCILAVGARRELGRR